MKAIARFKNEKYCMDLSNVDKLVTENNSVKYLLVRRHLSDRTVGAKGMKTKDSEERSRAFLPIVIKKEPKEVWVKKGTKFARDFYENCKAEKIQIHSTVSETETAFAERTKRSSKIILYRCILDYEYS